MKNILKIVIWCFLIILALAAIIFSYFFVGNAPVSKNITWGVDFSQMQAENLKLDWKKAYLAIIDDLGVKNIKLHNQWDWIEGKKNKYYFNDTDWQLSQAKSKGVKIIYVVGMKTGRWPECHAPGWIDSFSKQQQALRRPEIQE